MAPIKRFFKSGSKAEALLPPKRASDPPPREAFHDESNWLVSYADMMTLLCGFFIMLFSMAKLDDHQYEKAKQEIARQFKGEYVSPSKDLAKQISDALLTSTDKAAVQDHVLIKPDPNGVSVVFESVLFFDTLSAEVKPEGRAALGRVIAAIRDKQIKAGKPYRIIVEGHTDSRPITGGSFPSNWELSAARAARVVRLFLDEGFAADRLTAIGYADTHPVAAVTQRRADGTLDDAALAKNRRVVLRILQPGTETIPLPNDDFVGPKPAGG